MIKKDTVMAEDKKDKKNDEKKLDEEKPKKKKLKFSKPKPIFYYITVPALLIFVIFITLNKIYLPKDEDHETKIQKVLETNDIVNEENVSTNGEISIEDTPEEVQEVDENGIALFDTHNYYQFEAPFSVNIKKTKKVLTFDLAISTFQTNLTAGFFLESFSAFVPALRSEVLKELSKYDFEELKSSQNRKNILNTLKNVINNKLQELGSEPSVDRVFFVNYLLT
tara:strand:+ start:1268 stop:1939 length:672 start_codon:yes stop_codon:yes gene_type:complete